MSSSAQPRPPSNSQPISTGQSGRAADISARMQAAITVWRTRLLDLSKRNKALNFKANRVSTVTIVDEQPAEVYRHLCIDGKPMRFSPTLPSVAKRKAGATDPEASDAAQAPLIDDETDAPQPAELDFAPYDPEALDERHTDDVLQSLATPEALDKSLRRLDEQARGTIEEQGVNVLFLALGMLHYTESSDTADIVRAPLVMVPVQLTRKSARSGYVVEATDDEPMVNPALIEHLRRSFAIELPSIAVGEGENEAGSLQDFYRAVTAIVAERTQSGMAGWAVKTDIFLGLFSFQKLVMFKDLEANAQAFTDHALIRQLVSREPRTDSIVMGLPDDVRAMDLDREFAPEATAQVVDADSSQLRAIAAVSRGHSLVLEGPPGTGKSQTITNLIAQALSDGKSVLFVAEKMAALQVVHSRLVNAGLGEFCLELHASKANKRLVMQEIRTAIDASLQRLAADRSTQRLPIVRAQLSDYVWAVHSPAAPLGISPFVACGLLDVVLDAPRYAAKLPLADMTMEKLGEIERLLGELADAAVAIGVPANHPWRNTARTLYLPRSIDELRAQLNAVVEQLAVVAGLAEEAQHSFSLPPILTLDDVRTAATIAQVFHDSPGAPLAVLQSDAWNAAPPEALSLIEAGRQLQRLHGQVHEKFTEAVLDVEHEADVLYIERKTSGFFGFLAFLDGRYRATKARWTGYRKPGYSGSIAGQAADMRIVDRYTKARAALAANAGSGQALFGALWLGERSDWDALERYISWVVRVRGACVAHGLSAEALSVASRPAPDISRIVALEKAANDATVAVAALRTAVEWPADYLAGAPITETASRARDMAASMGGAAQWATFEQSRRQVATTAASELLAIAMRNSGGESDVAFSALPRMFRRAVLERFLEDVINERPVLRDFRTLTHEQRLREFRQLDERVLKENRASVVARLRESTQKRLQEPAARAGLPFIQRELAKQRNISPLRKTLQNAEATVRAIKPCFLMSPLTVAQYLGGAAPSFDLVIFDEASQLPSEDAVGAIARGRQLVVVGDPKQLPPTNFFAAAGTAAIPKDADGEPIVEDAESVLEEYMGVGMPVTRLKWHYRSAHESLITFSNASFYDSDLYTFPSVETNSAAAGLSFEYVADGVYEGGGVNRVEARRVVDAIVRHAKECPKESLGVGTFNMRQQLAILDELELRRREDPSIEPFFARGGVDPFFVKNLENIQGDERDVIFLSVTYAKAVDGRLRYNFGPINGENGWRRLNVLTSRARKRMRVFSSIRGEDINSAGTTARGAQLLRDFLNYAETGRLDSIVAKATAATESPFEAQVVSELTRRGVKVVPQVGVSGYRIDIGVLDDDVAGRYVCGIECDGVAYHSAETARDRDRLRQQVLEARGWTIIRLWSTDWFKDRDGQIERLMKFIEAAKTDAQHRIQSEMEAESRANALQEVERRAAAERTAEVDAAQLTRVREAVVAGPYSRPSVPAYAFASGQGRYAGAEFLETPSSHVAAAIVEVVSVESPVHVDDLQSRIAAMWGLGRVGSRIESKIDVALAAAARSGQLVQRGDFVWTPAMVAGGRTGVPVRGRSGTRISGDRVATEEVQGAIALVLQAAGGMMADELLSEVRQILGVGKGAVAPVFDAALAAMVREQVVGEGSGGFALRE